MHYVETRRDYLAECPNCGYEREGTTIDPRIALICRRCRRGMFEVPVFMFIVLEPSQ